MDPIGYKILSQMFISSPIFYHSQTLFRKKSEVAVFFQGKYLTTLEIGKLLCTPEVS